MSRDDFEKRVRDGEKVRGEPFELEKDNYITGVYLGKKGIEVKGKIRTLHQVRNYKDGKVYDIWGTTILNKEIDFVGITPGDGIGIKYLGIVGEKECHDWLVLKEEKDDGTT